MKLFLLLSALLSLASLAHAQTDFFGQPKVRPATPQQIDEAFAIYDQCKGSDMTSKYYDCNCVARNFLDARTRDPDSKADPLIAASRKKCANTPDIAGSSYQRCLDWAPQLRNDYDDYCTCYANTFAKSFAKTPTDSIRGRELIMTRALSSCNDGTELADRRARQSLIDQLKKQGVYETLFPNVKTNSSPAPAARP